MCKALCGHTCGAGPGQLHMQYLRNGDSVLEGAAGAEHQTWSESPFAVSELPSQAQQLCWSAGGWAAEGEKSNCPEMERERAH